jgi:hypothetical protein
MLTVFSCDCYPAIYCLVSYSADVVLFDGVTSCLQTVSMVTAPSIPSSPTKYDRKNEIVVLFNIHLASETIGYALDGGVLLSTAAGSLCS